MFGHFTTSRGYKCPKFENAGRRHSSFYLILAIPTNDGTRVVTSGTHVGCRAMHHNVGHRGRAAIACGKCNWI